MPNDVTRRSHLTKTAMFGGVALILYFLLYLYEDNVMAITSRGHWYFLAPVVIAFVFSFVHGNFTSYFWEALGIKAKK